MNQATRGLAAAGLSVLLLATAGCGAAAEEQEWPSQPIQIIVPWAAGGSTDQVTRRLAREMEAAMDVRVVVQNTPGASGAIGTREALQSQPDGYTWTAGAASTIGLYPILDLLDTSLDDWHLFLAVENVAVISVPEDAPWEDFGELLEAMREQPGEIRVGTAGVASSGHLTIERVADHAEAEYRHVTYDGGNPAVLAATAGEVDVTTQLAVEQAEMIRAGRLRPLAAYADQPLELEGHGTIPPITDWFEDVEVASDYFGISVHRDVPEQVLERMQRVWDERISQSEELQTYARRNGAFLNPIYGEEARRQGRRKVQSDAWILHRLGHAERNPADLGIPPMDGSEPGEGEAEGE